MYNYILSHTSAFVKYYLKRGGSIFMLASRKFQTTM
nr:MAG TPA: hypothetical protein [Caudoviricetes sp.]